MISIIIPIHNQADKFSACLDSILKQAEKDWELVIVDDGSTDHLKELIEQYRTKIPEDRFHFFSKQNEGSNPTRNYGFARSKGEMVIFVDADVIMNEEMLSEMKKTLEIHPEASFAFSSFFYGKKLFKLFEYDEQRLKSMPYIHTSSLIRRTDFPGFDPAIKRLQDWDLWLTMLEQGHRGVWIDAPLYTTQLGGGHFSQWLPSFAYKLFPFLPAVRKYQKAVAAIQSKHKLI